MKQIIIWATLLLSAPIAAWLVLKLIQFFAVKKIAKRIKEIEKEIEEHNKNKKHEQRDT